MPSKKELIALLEELAELTTLAEGSPQSFRVRAYEVAATELSMFDGDLAPMSVSALTKIDGVGKSTAQKIREYYDTGTITRLEELRAEFPPEYVELSKIPGVGPKKLMKLRDELGVRNADDLRAAVAAERIRTLPGFGKKSEENIAHALERMGKRGKDVRTPIAVALPRAEALVARLADLPQVAQVQYCGSLRRFRETIGDVDLTVASDDPAPIMEAFTSFDVVKEVIARGETKSSILTTDGLQVDLRVVTPAQYGAAILYFTGSKQHNIELRQRALARSWTLNEYALTEIESGDIVASATEEDIYDALELDWVPPTMREATGEVEAAAARSLPRTPTLADVRGELLAPLGEDAANWIAAARQREHAYLALISAADADVAADAERVSALRKKHGRLRVLHGARVGIADDGALVVPDGADRADLWIATPVSYELSRDRHTERLVTAMGEARVRVIAGLTGRAIGHREAAEPDAEAVFAAAAKTGTAIAVDGDLRALDPPAELLRRGAQSGARFLLTSGAQRPEDLGALEYATRLATRGWLENETIVNCWERERLMDWLGS